MHSTGFRQVRNLPDLTEWLILPAGPMYTYKREGEGGKGRKGKRKGERVEGVTSTLIMTLTALDHYVPILFLPSQIELIHVHGSDTPGPHPLVPLPGPTRYGHTESE